MNTRETVNTKDEITTRIKELQKEIEQFKKCLLKKDMDTLMDESYLEIAAEQLGYKLVLELKKVKYQALIKAREKSKRFTSLATVCKYFDLKRDAYYKYKRRANKRLQVEQKMVLK